MSVLLIHCDMQESTPPVELAILRVFTFSSSLQRMSVIVSDMDTRQLSLYAKGSPEMIAKLSRPETGEYTCTRCEVL